jgi:hypothetical protein
VVDRAVSRAVDQSSERAASAMIDAEDRTRLARMGFGAAWMLYDTGGEKITALTQVSARGDLVGFFCITLTRLPRKQATSYVAVPRHSSASPQSGTHRLGSLARFVRSVLARPRRLECSTHMKSTIGVVARLGPTAVVKILLPGIAVGPPTLAALEHRERPALVRRNK